MRVLSVSQSLSSVDDEQYNYPSSYLECRKKLTLDINEYESMKFGA